MPIPFILGAAALAAAGYGVKKGLDAKEDYELADKNNKNSCCANNKFSHGFPPVYFSRQKSLPQYIDNSKTENGKILQ